MRIVHVLLLIKVHQKFYSCRL